MQFSNEAELYKVIGSNIKYYREQAGLTQIQLSEQLQISISYLSKTASLICPLEASGCTKSLSISVLNHIANTLDVDITEFFQRR